MNNKKRINKTKKYRKIGGSNSELTSKQPSSILTKIALNSRNNKETIMNIEETIHKEIRKKENELKNNEANLSRTSNLDTYDQEMIKTDIRKKLEKINQLNEILDLLQKIKKIKLNKIEDLERIIKEKKNTLSQAINMEEKLQLSKSIKKTRNNIKKQKNNLLNERKLFQKIDELKELEILEEDLQENKDSLHKTSELDYNVKKMHKTSIKKTQDRINRLKEKIFN